MKVLIIPQFSMRSHKTGTYSLLADGNLNIVLHHIFNSSKTNEYTITIPDKHAHADLEVLEDKILPMFKCKITILPIKYGLNADDNRTVVPDSINVNFLEYAQVISYFENLRPGIPWVLKMHMSKIQELDRPYADKHYESFIDALYDPNLIQADVLNYAQYEQVERTHYLRAYKVNVNEQCLNKKFYKKMFKEFTNYKMADSLDTVIPYDAIFFPFRISDKAYDFEAVKKLGRPIVVTDPNESLDDYDCEVIKLQGNMKEILYSMIALMQHRKDIKIVLYEDCELAVHQLIVELAYMLPNSVVGVNADDVVERYTF